MLKNTNLLTNLTSFFFLSLYIKYTLVTPASTIFREMKLGRKLSPDMLIQGKSCMSDRDKRVGGIIYTKTKSS